MSDGEAALRYCPLCRSEMPEEQCPRHGVPTLPQRLLALSGPKELLGKVLAERYRVDEPLGRGGMGEVYRGVDLEHGTPVAIKALRPDRLTETRQTRRFEREAQALTQLRSPFVVRILDVHLSRLEPAPFLVLELLEGHTLAEVLEIHDTLEPRRVARLLAQVSQALLAAQALGIVHRDLKPQNLFILGDDPEHEQAKVMDFGLSKRLDSHLSAEESLTITGARVGTPFYMSPEQIDDRDIDFRTDLYALGCILHKCLTGLTPFEAEHDINSEMVVTARHLIVPAPKLPDALPDGAPMPVALHELHAALLQKDPSDRPSDISLVIDVLEAVAHGDDLGAQRHLRELQRTAQHGNVHLEKDLNSTEPATQKEPSPTPCGGPAGLRGGAMWIWAGLWLLGLAVAGGATFLLLR